MTYETLGLPRTPVVLVDSSALIYLIEGSERRRETVAAVLEAVADSGGRAVASTIVWTEVLARPLSERNAALAERYRILLADSRRIQLVPVDVAIAEEAARLVAGNGLGIPDALHLATALVHRANAVLGNDEAWKSVPGCPRLLLVDEIAFDFPGFA